MARYRLCLECGELISSGVRCHDCHAEHVRLRNLRPEHLARMAMPRTQRARVLARDGHRCVDCRSTDDLTIDHIIPLATGKRHYRDDELATRCRSCNSRLGGALRHAQ
jgi:5-methylcytosine-specific restriction endonuclease McrA